MRKSEAIRILAKFRFRATYCQPRVAILRPCGLETVLAEIVPPEASKMDAHTFCRAVEGICDWAVKESERLERRRLAAKRRKPR